MAVFMALAPDLKHCNERRYVTLAPKHSKGPLLHGLVNSNFRQTKRRLADERRGAGARRGTALCITCTICIIKERPVKWALLPQMMVCWIICTIICIICNRHHSPPSTPLISPHL